jgi:hypothetical protein
MIEDIRPEVKSKASTKFIERIAKHPDWGRLSERVKPNNG